MRPGAGAKPLLASTPAATFLDPFGRPQCITQLCCNKVLLRSWQIISALLSKRRLAQGSKRCGEFARGAHARLYSATGSLC